jgi:hypothetical protein
VATAIDSKSNSVLSAVEADAIATLKEFGRHLAMMPLRLQVLVVGGGVPSTAATVEVCCGVLKTVGVRVCGGGGSAIVDGDKISSLLSFYIGGG